ncbi:hypothetical protein LINPERPRIM_LOCUS2410 [Linum perenne]
MLTFSTWAGRAIVRSLSKDRCLPSEGIIYCHRIIGLLEKEMFRVRREKRRAIISRRQCLTTAMAFIPGNF